MGTRLAPMGDAWPIDAAVVAARGAVGSLASGAASGVYFAAEPAPLIAWLDLVATWNARTDLTAARSAGELVDLMLVDALVLAARIPEGARVVDVGTGAGAPGLGLALVRADLRVTLVEPLGKRAAFLRTVLGTVGRADVAIERVRGEDAVPKGPWDVAISRATLPPAEWLRLGAKLVKPGGSVWVLLAKEDPPSLGGLRVAEDVSYRLPHADASRRAVRYVKEG